MINANGTDPNKYFEGMRAVFFKATDERHSKKSESLQSYCGIYGAQPWGSEVIVTTWNDNLALLFLPNDNPKNLVLIKQIKDDTFRRIRDDGELGEEIKFERDKSGKITRMWRHSNYRVKMN
jgi:hypothetical protein